MRNPNRRELQCRHQPPKELPATKIPHRRKPIVLPQKGQGIKMETVEVIKAQINNNGAGFGMPTIRKINAAINEIQKRILIRL